jgi:hypothetical protein
MAINPQRLRQVAASLKKLADPIETDDTQPNDRATVPGKRDVQPVRLKDGTPNPETDRGRAMIIKDTELAIADLYMRAGILKKVAIKASDVKTREDFREQLLLIVEGVQKLNTHDLPLLKDAVFHSLSLYGKARGQETTRSQFDQIINKAASARRRKSSRGA